jgi:predicted GNAT family N-acyltransferase
MRISRITTKQTVYFRRQYLSPALVWDSWDVRSAHYASFQQDDIVATARVTPAWNNRLPFLDHVILNDGLKSPGVEIGRVLIAPRVRKSSVLWFLCRKIVLDLHAEHGPCHVYVDSIVQSDLKHGSLTRNGLTSTGAQYFDVQYGAQSIVFTAPLGVCLTAIARASRLG